MFNVSEAPGHRDPMGLLGLVWAITPCIVLCTSGTGGDVPATGTAATIRINQIGRDAPEYAVREAQTILHAVGELFDHLANGMRD